MRDDSDAHVHCCAGLFSFHRREKSFMRHEGDLLSKRMNL
jgi:hypothetical protein